MNIERITVYCGAKIGNNPDFLFQAQSLGKQLACHGITLVYGGASIGLMGTMANAALDAGGKVIGVIPEHILKLEAPLSRVTQLEVVPTMHERKARMIALADGFIALPGGIGTLEELLEVTVLKKLGVHHKPIGLLGCAGFTNPLLGLLDHLINSGFANKNSRSMWIEKESSDELLNAMIRHVSETDQLPFIDNGKYSTNTDDNSLVTKSLSQLIRDIQSVNHERTLKTLPRRIMKIAEELGELNQAYLSVSSPYQSARGKSWSDVREELADLFIVVSDCLLTPLPGDEMLPDSNIEKEITNQILRKIEKWRGLLNQKIIASPVNDQKYSGLEQISDRPN